MDIDSLKQMFDMHIKECDGRDVRNMQSFSRIESMFKGIWNSQEQLGEKITTLQIRAAIALGTLFSLGKMLDYAIAWYHK